MQIGLIKGRVLIPPTHRQCTVAIIMKRSRDICQIRELDQNRAPIVMVDHHNVQRIARRAPSLRMSRERFIDNRDGALRCASAESTQTAFDSQSASPKNISGHRCQRALGSFSGPGRRCLSAALDLADGQHERHGARPRHRRHLRQPVRRASTSSPKFSLRAALPRTSSSQSELRDHYVAGCIGGWRRRRMKLWHHTSSR